MVELGIDEMTAVLRVPPRGKPHVTVYDWKDFAETMIGLFLNKSDFIRVFGEQTVESHLPSGYTVGYTCGEHSFYMAIAYHEYQIDMGVIVKLSAQALDYYCAHTGLRPYQFLQCIQDGFYSTRVSRVDLTADYIDEDVDVTAIYQGLMDKKIAVFREYESKKTGEKAFRRIDMNYQGFIKGSEVPTIYLGSAKSNSRLRIYDKRTEQIERSGTKLDKATACKDWARFEGVFRDEYAHQIGEALLNIKDDDEYANMIACTMIQKFRLMYVDNGVLVDDTEYSQRLLDCISNRMLVLNAPTSRNFDLVRSMIYLFVGSGAFSMLYKMRSIWGDHAVTLFLRFMYDCLDEYVPNDDCLYWLRRNEQDYKKAYPDFNIMFRSFRNIVAPMMQK